MRVRQALGSAGALGASLTEMLDTTGAGIIHLDRHGQIVEMNDRALDLLRTGDGLFDDRGFLFARTPTDNAKLQGVLNRALPPLGTQGVGGSTVVRRASALPLAVHVNPVDSAGNGLRHLAGRGARACRGPDEPAPHQSGHGRGGPRSHENGESGGGAVGRRQERSPRSPQRSAERKARSAPT